jgi:ribosomal protein L40E
MKSKKKLAAWGVILIVLLSIPFSVMIIGEQKGSENVKLSTSDGAMVDGTVSPFYGSAGTNHTFSILVKDQNYTQVNVVIVDVWSSTTVYNRSMTSTDTADGRLFTFYADPQAGTGLNTSEFGYWFTADTGQKWVVTSGSNYGPIHVSDGDLYAHWLPILLFALFIQVGVLYFLLILLSYMSERSKAKVAQMEKEYGAKGKLPPTKDGKEEKFVCSECGADVPASADKCPQCGERFDDAKGAEDAKPQTAEKGKDEFVCTDCGAKVDESAKTCWNCGKEFEN